MTTITVRYFAGARAVAGTSQHVVIAPSTAEALATVTQDRPELAGVMAICSFLLNGHPHAPSRSLIDVPSTLDVLPPFAGG